MSIRLRLALWYGALTALILLVSGLVSYSFHSRGHYEELDWSLMSAADHAQAEVVVSDEGPHFNRSLGGLDIALRLYDAVGVLEVDVPGLGSLPPMKPREILDHPAEPAFDTLAGLAPAITSTPSVALQGAFSLACNSLMGITGT